MNEFEIMIASQGNTEMKDKFSAPFYKLDFLFTFD